MSHHEVANAWSTEATPGRIGIRTNWAYRQERSGAISDKNAQIPKILSGQKWVVSGNFGIKHLSIGSYDGCTSGVLPVVYPSVSGSSAEGPLGRVTIATTPNQNPFHSALLCI